MTKQVDILAKFLDAELTPEKDDNLKRFGADLRIKALSAQKMGQVREQATRGKGGFNSLDFQAGIIVAGTSNLDWNDKALKEKLGATDAVDAVQKRLLAGEIEYLAEEIAKLSGFGNDDDEIGEAKN